MINWHRVWRATKLAARHPVRLYRALKLVDEAPGVCKLILLGAGWTFTREWRARSSLSEPPTAVLWTLWERDQDIGDTYVYARYRGVTLEQALAAHVLEHFTLEDFA